MNVTPATEQTEATKAITALRKRLSRWELEHLRAHCAELADKREAAQHRIEALEEELNQAWRWGEHWRDQSQDLANELHEAGKTVGLTIDGELVVMPKADPTAAAATALQRRARRGILFSAINGAADRFHFWQGVASAAEDMINGNALRMAANDADASADQEQTSLETAWAALPVGVKHLTMADVQQLLATQGIESAADLVAHRDIGAGQVLKNDEVAPIANLQDEHAQARADVGNGTGLHCMASSAGEAAMLGQQGGAA